MFDVCFDLVEKDIKFNPAKSVFVVFKPKSSNLYCLNVRLDCDMLVTFEYISCTKYLGFNFNMNSQDGNDMLRQKHTI